jgi:hypothetical protein
MMMTRRGETLDGFSSFQELVTYRSGAARARGVVTTRCEATQNASERVFGERASFVA